MRKHHTFVLTIFLLAVAPLLAQVETARIEGTVTDSTQAVIPGAEITITHLQTNRQFKAVRSEETHSGRRKL